VLTVAQLPVLALAWRWEIKEVRGFLHKAAEKLLSKILELAGV
jgi:hypothetical protein